MALVAVRTGLRLANAPLRCRRWTSSERRSTSSAPTPLDENSHCRRATDARDVPLPSTRWQRLAGWKQMAGDRNLSSPATTAPTGPQGVRTSSRRCGSWPACADAECRAHLRVHLNSEAIESSSPSARTRLLRELPLLLGRNLNGGYRLLDVRDLNDLDEAEIRRLVWTTSTVPPTSSTRS